MHIPSDDTGFHTGLRLDPHHKKIKAKIVPL